MVIGGFNKLRRPSVTPASTFEINAPAVAGEIIDGEAIILHLPKGHYFSSEGSGAMIWAGIERKMPLDSIADALAQRFGLDTAAARTAAEDFIAELVRHDLVRPAEPGESVVDPGQLPGGGDYSPPRIEIYTDMQELLLLDPIHEVDPAGWPVAPDRACA